MLNNKSRREYILMIRIDKSYYFAALTVILWSTLATVSKILLNNINVMLVLAATSVIASAVLFLYNLFRGNLNQFRNLPFREILSICLLGFIGFFLYNWFYLLGIAMIPSQQAMIINYLWPALIIVFSAVLYKERLTYKKILAVIASLIGVTIVAINGNAHSLSGGNLKGVIYCLIAAVCYALYAALNKKQTYPKELSMFIVFSVTSIISVLCSIMNGSIGQIAHLNAGMWIGIFYSGIFINAVGYTSWMLALEYGNTAVISNLAYIVPFLSMIFARIVLKEEISIYSIVGIVMIVGGIGLQIREA